MNSRTCLFSGSLDAQDVELDESSEINRALRDGKSIRGGPRELHHWRFKVREVLSSGGGVPQIYRLREFKNFPKLALVLLPPSGGGRRPLPKCMDKSGHDRVRFLQNLSEFLGCLF